VTQSPPGSTSPNDFEYSYGSPVSGGTSFDVKYYVNDTWFFKYNGTAIPYGSNITEPFSLNLMAVTQTPYGNIPMTPYGIENENTPYTGLANPQNMNSLSYYYGIPKMTTTGTINAGNRSYQVNGSIWLEHQWGNFNFQYMPWAANYIWSAWQFNDGSIFTLREWYDQNNQPILNIGRNVYATRDGNITYAFGDSTVVTGLKTWKSPITGRNYPLWGKVTTPRGTYYYSPIMNPYEMVYPTPAGGQGTLWEGPIYIRTGSITGPIVGKGFWELPTGLTQNYPELD
jgi:predicted secreted hydrolase